MIEQYLFHNLCSKGFLERVFEKYKLTPTDEFVANKKAFEKPHKKEYLKNYATSTCIFYSNYFDIWSKQ